MNVSFIKLFCLVFFLVVIWLHFLGKKFGGKPWCKAYYYLSNSEKAKQLGVSQSMKNNLYLIYAGWALMIGLVVFLGWSL